MATCLSDVAITHLDDLFRSVLPEGPERRQRGRVLIDHGAGRRLHHRRHFGHERGEGGALQ